MGLDIWIYLQFGGLVLGMGPGYGSLREYLMIKNTRTVYRYWA